jgi:hypothetical protein
MDLLSPYGFLPKLISNDQFSYRAIERKEKRVDVPRISNKRWDRHRVVWGIG